MSRPASHAAAIGARLAMELRLTARRGENVLVTVVIPAVVLLFFGSVPVLDPGAAERTPVDLLLPGVLALAVIATSLVNLGIATAYERHYRVLKRLGGSPLGRGDLVVAKVGAVLAVELAQVALLVAIAAGLLGWSLPAGASLVVVAVALLLGTAAFGGLGLLLAGTLRAEATLALANGLFLGFLLVGGILLPVERLPEPLGSLAALLPAAALVEALRAGLGEASGDVGAAFAVLTAWAVASVAAAARLFRWE
ncbi:MAG TPA: ABC transporter permease [Clostridia bacterium]|nr:ABC transporter permease [Clostridia bacterium]